MIARQEAKKYEKEKVRAAGLKKLKAANSAGPVAQPSVCTLLLSRPSLFTPGCSPARPPAHPPLHSFTS